MHSIDRQRAQLAVAGIAQVPLPDLGFLDGELDGFGLPDRFALLIPGSSPERPGKRWPAGRYGELAVHLAARGVTAAVVGGEAETAETAAQQ